METQADPKTTTGRTRIRPKVERRAVARYEGLEIRGHVSVIKELRGHLL